MITDMEGVSGIYDSELQVQPFQSPRWEESRKLLTGEVNAAVEGLLAGGATDVVVWDGHDSSRTLSVLDIHPKARLLTGRPISRTLELDSILLRHHLHWAACDGRRRQGNPQPLL